MAILKYPILLLSVLFVAAGCSVIRKKDKTPERPQTTVQGPDYRHDTELGRPVRPDRKDEPEQRRDERREQETTTAKADRPRMAFSGIETDHVRVKGVNPVPAGGLELDLDRMNKEFCYPLDGKLISDYGMRSGRMHTGIDIKAAPNQVISAAFAGVVRMSKNYSSYGNIIVIRHYDGFETVYAHNSKNLVDVNDVVEAGQPIALAGRTGRATTEHLHFEVRAGGQCIDPKMVVDPSSQSLRDGKMYITEKNGVVAAATWPAGAQHAADELIAAEQNYEADRQAALAASTENGRPKASQSEAAAYYRVKKGDTLGHIAQRHGTTVNRLCQLNNIKSTAVLQINQRLRVK